MQIKRKLWKKQQLIGNMFLLLQENPAEEDAVIVDKILGCRMRKPDPDVSMRNTSLKKKVW